MIEVQDEDVPSGAAVFTFKEFMQGVQEHLFWHDRGNALIERYGGHLRSLQARAWIWKDGEIQPGIGHVCFRRQDERTLILWWPAKERMN